MLPAAKVVDVFDKANQVLAVGHGNAPCYRTIFVSSRGGWVSSSACIHVLTQKIEYLGETRALFVASGEAAFHAVQESPYVGSLRDGNGSASELLPVGSGDVLLAAAGVSSHASSAGKRTTAGDQRFRGADDIAIPQVHATRSGVRQALELIKLDFGIPVLRRVLELLPDTGLPEFSSIANDSGKSIKQKIHESARWITQNCNRSISVTVAAQTAGMSERSYLRHFRAEIGVKPSEYLRRSRVELAASMLESVDLPVDKIARRCGLTSGECLARLFRQIWNISPTEYRNRLR
jgi:transcriptional regulator GlxA family with amidase domain